MFGTFLILPKFLMPKNLGFDPQYQVSSRFRTKVTFSLIVVVLCLLQPLHPVVDLQINVRFLKVVSKDSSYLKCCIDTSTIRTKFTILLHEFLLGLLQPLNPVIELRILKMVSNDSL